MPVYLHNQVPETRIVKKPLLELVRRVLRTEGRQGEISIILVNDRVMAQLNERYHHVEGSTDVLAFPIGEGRRILADIYISLEQARRQAQDYGQPLAEELRLLVVHGILHLCGYDDLEPESRRLMRERESHYLRYSKTDPVL